MSDGVVDQHVRAILEWILRDPEDSDTAALLEQARTATVRTGTITWLSLDVAPDCPRTQSSRTPWPRDADVIGPDGELVGGIVLWVEDGRLSTLEYYWLTDAPPEALPSIAQLR